jgi:hypothetical protein
MLRPSRLSISHGKKEAATVDRAADTRLPRPNNKGELYRIFEDGVGIAFWKSGAKREAHLMPIPFTLSAFVAWAAPRKRGWHRLFVAPRPTISARCVSLR